MMRTRRTAGVVSGIVVLLLLYLFFWPVPIDPVAWEAPENRGLVDPFGVISITGRNLHI